MVLTKTSVKRSLLFLAVILPAFAVAQDLPNVIPPSPQSQELNKYTDFPVDYSTGVPEISIPLYVIKTKGLNIPITLNYHASGIKCSQDDGDVGLGWNLSCNYRVSRTIYGRPDSKDIEMPADFESALQTFRQNLALAETPGVEAETPEEVRFEWDKYLAKFANIHDPEMTMPPLIGPLLDGEFDQFNYSLPGQSGNFIISDRINKIVSEFNPTNNKFSYTDDVASNNLTRGIVGFSVKDGKQNMFSFGEQVDKSGFKVLEAIDDYYQKTVATAWALTDIETKYGEKIKFSYDSKAITTKYQVQETINVLNCFADQVWEANVNSEFPNRNYTVFVLSKIVTPTERIEFVASSNVLYPNKIDQINVYDLSDNALVKRIQFYYGSEYAYPNNYVFLDSVKVFGRGLAGSQTYRLEYYNRNLPLNTILVPDQWGYNKVETSTYHLLHNEFQTDSMANLGTDCFPDIWWGSSLGNQKGGNFSDRMFNANPEFFSLKAVSYPSGGKTVYVYEPNKIRDGQYQFSWRQWGGIRIKAITHYDGNAPRSKRTFTYGVDESGTGIPRYNIDYRDFRKEYIVFPPYEPGVGEDPDNLPAMGEYLGARRAVDYSSYIQGDPEAVDSRVYYPCVTEHYTSAENENLTDGKTVYSYDLPNLPVRDNFSVEINESPYYQLWGAMRYQGAPKFISRYQSWKKPLLAEKRYYSTANTLIKKETYTYSDRTYPTFKGLKVRPFTRAVDPIELDVPYYYDFIGSFYNYGVYEIETGLSLLQQNESTLYTENGAITNTTIFDYNPYNQVISEINTDSKNQITEKRTVYSSDNSGGGGVSTRMFQANDVYEILEQSVLKNNVVLNQVSTEFTELPGEIFVPDKLKRLNTITQELEEEILYHRYDSKGNLLSVSKGNDVITSFIWSYNSSLPIAEIRGASYESIEAIIGTQIMQEFSTRENPSKSAIDNFLAPLRGAIENGTLPNSELTSFTYDPLSGMTSQTDANDRTTYYEYNEFGDLSLVKDNEGNVRKKYSYNYQGQGESVQAGCVNTTANWVSFGLPSCEVVNGANTGRQLQPQIDNNPCSYTYNKTRTFALANNSLCPMTIYAKLSYEDYYSYPPYETGADVIVRFYLDAACQNPVSVSDLQLNYTVTGFDGVANFSYDGSITANGSYILLEGAAILSYYADGTTLSWSEGYALQPGNYTIL